MDWQLGKPPYRVPVRAWIGGNVRRGYSDGGWFHFVDCTHPMRNSIANLDSVDGWAVDMSWPQVDGVGAVVLNLAVISMGGK